MNQKKQKNAKMIQINAIKLSERSTAIGKRNFWQFDDNYKLITSEEEQSKTITSYFTQLFSANDSVEPISPRQMEP